MLKISKKKAGKIGRSYRNPFHIHPEIFGPASGTPT
jgi:hypothetical protein